MFDLLIDNAVLCDGTGRETRPGALGVTDGRITYVGAAGVQLAKRVIDADGLVLAPGFIDPHTHYDAQICWDPSLTSSPWHGVTTVLLGNCGIGLAPCRPSSQEPLLRDLENVEGMPYAVMRSGVPFSWETHGEFLDTIDRSGPSINVAALVSLTALRHYVMGEASIERAATEDEVLQLQRAFRAAMATGASGFSTDLLPHHLGYKGRPLACRNASRRELAALCAVLRELDRGTISISLASMNMGTAPMSDEEVDLLRMLVRDSGRNVTFLPLLSKADEIDFPRHTLGKLGDLVGRAVPQITPRPMVFLVNLRKPFRFGAYDAWKPALGADPQEQANLYRSRAWRDAAILEMRTHARQFRWDNFRVLKVRRGELAQYEGRTLDEIARSEAKSPLDALLDIGLSDQLDTIFELQNANLNPAAVEWLVKDPRLMFGLSDAGAHVDQLCDVGYTTAVLDLWVRKRPAISLPEAVRRMTSMPARVLGIPDRGELREGLAADLVLFDPQKVSCDPPVMVQDLPLGAERMIAHARGIAATFVAGVQVVADGELTGARPGRVLRDASLRPAGILKDAR